MGVKVFIFNINTNRNEIEGNVFRSVCQSFCPQVGIDFPACITGHTTRGVCIKGGFASGQGLHLGKAGEVCIKGAVYIQAGGESAFGVGGLADL